MAMFYALLILSVFGSALSQIPSRNPCPAVKALQNFNVTQFVGRWYEAQRVYHNFEFHTKCNKIDYMPGDNGTITVINSFVNPVTGIPGSVEADIFIPNSESPGEMLIHMPLTPEGIDSNYYIVDTDYDSYAVILGCTDFPELSITYAWILTREPSPSDSILTIINEVLGAQLMLIPLSYFYNVEQHLCGG